MREMTCGCGPWAIQRALGIDHDILKPRGLSGTSMVFHVTHQCFFGVVGVYTVSL